MSNARVRAKELCDRYMWMLAYEDEEQWGPPHAPQFSVAAVFKGSVGKIMKRGHGSGRTLKSAQEAACRAALDE